MPKQKKDAAQKEPQIFAKRSRKKGRYVLKIYVAGLTAKSAVAIENVINICDEHMPGLCDFEVIDLLKKPKLAKGEQIVAIPTLIKKLPPPIRRLIGDMSDTEKFLVGIDFKDRNGK